MISRRRPTQTGDEGTEQLRGRWQVLLAAMLWGTTGTAQALAPAGALPSSVGAVRLAIGGLALLAIAAARGALRTGRRWPVAILGAAAGAMAAYQLFFFAGVARTGVAVGTVVTIGSSPVLAGMLGWIANRERPGGRWAAATACAIAGCGLLLGTGDRISIDPAGVLLALGAGLAYATYAVTSKRLLEHQPPDAAMAAVFCLGAALLAPWLVTGELGWLGEWRGLAVALHLGLVATAAAYVLFARGLALVPVATAVTLSLAEPLTATLLGIVLLGEQLAPVPALGLGLLLAGLLMLALGRTGKGAG